MSKRFVILALMVCLPAGLLADFSYEQTTKMTGGALAGMMKVMGAFSKQLREPTKSSVAIKGNRMANLSSTHSTIIDLDKETFTEINPQKKTYSVVTFAEMQEAMRRAVQKMSQQPNQPETAGADKVDMDFKISVKETGQTKQISGLDTKEMIMTFDMEATDKQSGQQGTITVTTDLWLAAKIPGYEEVRDFHRRMGARMAWTAGSAMTMGRADIGKGMAGAAKEIAKMDGVPVLQIVKMGGAGSGKTISAGWRRTMKLLIIGAHHRRGAGRFPG